MQAASLVRVSASLKNQLDGRQSGPEYPVVMVIGAYQYQ